MVYTVSELELNVLFAKMFEDEADASATAFEDVLMLLLVKLFEEAPDSFTPSPERIELFAIELNFAFSSTLSAMLAVE
ncbi:Uncharacterised protein [Candidatus Anstonella stagnisolia]|nr:Uncharacterised protein [Candidatus Anstonella stagnisolia]